jgi:hypothetical protein
MKKNVHLITITENKTNQKICKKKKKKINCHVYWIIVLQKTSDKGWCEVMVDINPDKQSSNQFRFVLSPGATPNSTGYLRVS